MKLDITYGEVEMILTSIRTIRSGWQADAESKPTIRQMALEQVAAWDKLEAKVLEQYEEDEG